MKLILIISWLISIQFSSSIKHPMILIPCLGGSQIEVKMDKSAEIETKCRTDSSDFFTVWINLTYSLLHTPACMFNTLSLTYNEETRETENLPGIHTRVTGFGYTDNVRYLDGTALVAPYYNKLIKKMIKEGYTPGLSIRAAPYDFRKGPSEHKEYFERLKELIEDTYEKNGKKKVILVVHSHGGPMSLVFLYQQSQEWKDQYIAYEISLGAAWAGAIKAMEAYIDGFGIRGTEFIPKFTSGSLTNIIEEPPYPYIIIPGITLIPKKILRTFPVIIWLFPSPAAWNMNDKLVRVNDKDYTLENMEEFFSDLNEPSGWEMYKDIYPFMKELPEPGIDVHCLFGTDIRTVAAVHSNQSFWDSFRYPINGDGDGIVNLQSLEVCKNWIGGTKNVTVKTFWGVDHINIVSNSDIMDYIVQLVRSD